MPTTEPSADTDLSSLQDERTFLLRSLADLDAEHEAGDIEDEDYRSLTNDYTARAAAVLRAIQSLEGGGNVSGWAASGAARAAAGRAKAGTPVAGRRRPIAAAPPPSARRISGARAPAQRRRGRTVALLAGVVGFGIVAAWAVSQSSGTRQPGQTISGNAQITGTTAVQGGIDPRLATAASDVNKGQVTEALKLYDAVLRDDPNQPVALADGGWLEAQAGLAANRSDLVDTGLAKIDKAEKAAPSFADAHFFRGFLLLRAKNDAAGAVTELRLYLGTVNPSAPQVPSVKALLQEAIKAAGPNVPPGPNAPTTSVKAP